MSVSFQGDNNRNKNHRKACTDPFESETFSYKVIYALLVCFYWSYWFSDSRILRRSLVIFVTVIVVYAFVIPLVVHHSPWIQRSVAFSRKCWVTGEPTSRCPLQVPQFQLTVQRGSTSHIRKNWALKTRSTSTSARKTEPRLESGTLDVYAY